VTRDLLIHRVIARLNVGGPAMHAVLLTREFDARPVGLDPLGAYADVDGESGSAGEAPGAAEAATFHARLIAGSVLESEGDMSYFAEERGVEVIRLKEMSRNLSLLDDLRSFFQLWRLFRRERPDIVHTHTAKAGALGRLAAALAGVPVRIHTYHGHVLGGDYFSRWKTGLFRGIERLLAIQTDRLIVLTDSQRQELSADLGIARAEKFSVVPLGLELEPFARAAAEGASDEGVHRDADADPADEGAARSEAPADARDAARGRARRKLDLHPHDHVVGIVGRLVPIKNHELLFDAVPILQEQLKERRENRSWEDRPQDGDHDDGLEEDRRWPEDADLRILVVGSGEREEALEEYARNLGIQDCVRWLGWRDDLPEVYPAMDVLALPSKDEGTPVAVIEALAAGIPVVARDVGGVSEVLEGGKWGKLVKRNEEDEVDDEEDAEAPSGIRAHRFAEALAGVITDPPTPETRAAASRSVLERFGLDRLVSDLEAIYLQELDGVH